jgi:riboflavin synthase
MFTGIIEARGEIRSIETVGEFIRIRIASDLELTDVKEGDSVSVDGACLTAVKVDLRKKELTADVSSETLAVTTLAELKVGSKVNLEKAMRLDSRLGGHLVAGHVDCVGRIVEKRQAGPGWIFGFQADSGRYLVDKGSVAVDGISLTVNWVEGGKFRVMVIPKTAAATGLTEKKINDKVNLEFDLIGKYIEKFVSGKEQSGITEEKLKEYGFA